MSKELSLNKEKLKEKELTYKEKMTEKDLRYQEYEAIQADEEIPVGERVHREKEAAVVSIIEPGSHTIPTNTTVSKKVADQKKPKNNYKHSARQQHTRSKCASSVDRSEHLTNQREAVEASSSKPGDKVRVPWGENSAAVVKANSRTVEVGPSSPEVVQLESTSAKDLRREKERARQVLKEKEQATGKQVRDGGIVLLPEMRRQRRGHRAGIAQVPQQLASAHPHNRHLPHRLLRIRHMLNPNT